MYTQGTFRVYQQRSMDVEQKKQCYQVRKSFFLKKYVAVGFI